VAAAVHSFCLVHGAVLGDDVEIGLAAGPVRVALRESGGERFHAQNIGVLL